MTLIFPDQAAGGLGTLVVPNSAGLVKGAAHDAGRPRRSSTTCSAATRRRR
ncbi:MAG: hypothetical protein U0470_00140 [Anaerolineae bacterium]